MNFNPFKDKNGKVVIFLWPNSPLWAWIITKIILLFPLPTYIQEPVEVVSFGALFTWAWIELFRGANLFRRSLGIIMLTYLIFFRVQNYA